MKSIIRQAGLGPLVLRWYHTPLNRLRDCLREGGPFNQRRTERGRAEMEVAARALPVPAAAASLPAVALHLLTGRRFWYQTAFCLWSFARQTGQRLAPVIYDDGTLSDEYREPIARLFPATRFVAQAETVARLDAQLPIAQFPVLRERWRNYPNIRKLTDVHLGSSGWKLVLDSDLLFFHRPTLLVEWLGRPQQPLHAVDCATSYGYSRPLLNELAAQPVAELVNVGLTGLNSGEIDWEKIECWCRTLINREGANYYLEQALVAMLLAGRPCTIAPVAEYVTLPVPPEAIECHANMHHYVAHSKRWYFQHCWRKTLAS